MISDGTKRAIIRWIHVIFGILILGYIYRPLKKFQTTPRCSVYLRSCNPFGTLDVEGWEMTVESEAKLAASSSGSAFSR